MTTLIETIHDVGSFLRAPGRYHTTTGHQAYGVLQALGWHPAVHLGEELFFPEGSVLFAEVRSGADLVPNVEKIGWGTTDDYYERRLRDYDNWEVAFWREIVQNSRDAGATRLDMECVEDTYVDPETGERTECVRASATDNGSGMDYDTLMNAFFRRGGSEKTEGSVGGFGDAKNLILTPWLGYEVHTRTSIVRGRHEELFGGKLLDQDAPFLSGTKVTAWMPLTKTTTPEHAQLLVEQSSLDSMRFTVNGKVARSSVPQGKLVLEKNILVRGDIVGKLMVYHSPRAKRSGVYVRSHGIYMYGTQDIDDDFKGVVSVEVNAPPVDVFTAKRNELSFESTARADLRALLKKLSRDPQLTLKQVRDKKEIVFRGTGSIEVREGAVAEMAADILSKIDLSSASKKKKPGKALDISKADIEAMVDAMKRAGMGSSGDEGVIEMAPLPAAFGAAASQAEFHDVDQVATALVLAMWKPDFFLYQNISPWRLPKALHPETMSKKYHELLRVWTEVCRFLLVQFGMRRPFGVGWVFDSEYDPRAVYGESVIAAMYLEHDGVDWLLLNPVNIQVQGYGDSRTFSTVGDRYSLRDDRSLETLVSYAVHEITHMQGFIEHERSFASALTENMKVVFRLAPVLKKVVKAARAAVAETRAAMPSKPTRSTKQSAVLSWDGDEGFNDGRLSAVVEKGDIRGKTVYLVSVRAPSSKMPSWLYWNAYFSTERAARRFAECAYSSMRVVAGLMHPVPQQILWRFSAEEADNASSGWIGYGYDDDDIAVSLKRGDWEIVPRTWDRAEKRWIGKSGYSSAAMAMRAATLLYGIQRGCQAAGVDLGEPS